MVTNIKVTDATIALDDIGEGLPVLLLHGFPATRHLWSRVAPRLADVGFRVLVPDLVGYGASEAAAGVPVDMASQARWMLELLDALGLARAVVGAHDVGSAAAQLIVAYMDAAPLATDIFIPAFEVRLQSYIRPTSAAASRCVAPMKIR